MEIRSLKTFLQVVENGSFTKAAKTLGYTQSTVSFQINQLEEELGCKLFDRIGKSVTLTSRGYLLHAHALGINNMVHNMMDDFSRKETPFGQVHMYSSDSICEKMMLDNYAKFYSTYPDIKLIFSTGSTTDLVDVLEKNEADVIFTLDNHIYRPNFEIAKESPVGLVFVTSKKSPLAKKKHVTIEDILEYPLLLTESGMSYRKVLDDRLAQMSLAITPVLETGRTDIIIKSIAGGTGVSYLPEFSVRDAIEKKDIVKLDVEGFDITIWKQLIYRKDKWISGALWAFIEFVMEHEFDW